MTPIDVNTNSYTELIRDCIMLCAAALENDITPEMVARAKQRLDLLRITVDMNAVFAPADERSKWKVLQQQLRGVRHEEYH